MRQLMFIFVLLFITSEARRRKLDYCQNEDRRCDPNAFCKERGNSFRCVCNKGFTGNGRKCRDFDECLIGNGGCVHTCNNTKGTYECECREGFTRDPFDYHNCLDIDECLTDSSCDHMCINTLGSYRCDCYEGYNIMSDGTTCSPTDYCFEECDHVCNSDLVSPCSCLEGYKLDISDMKSCLPTCSVGNGGCQHYCTDIEQGTRCSCKEHYRLAEDGRRCLATCAVYNGGCEENCLDVPDGVICSCPEGLQLLPNGKSCQDINECLTDNGGCSYKCVNNGGSYECTCPPGYKLMPDEKTCHDINECAFNDTCDHFCHNTLGSYICTCKNGYQAYGVRSCGDIDECVQDRWLCEHDCINTPGSYICACRDGFRLHQNGYDCIDATRCSPLQTPVKAIMNCTSQYEGYFEETCQIECQKNAKFPGFEPHSMKASCGARTRYQWTVDGEAPVGAFLGCSETVYPSGYKRLFRMTFLARGGCNKLNETHQIMHRTFVRLLERKRPKWCRVDTCTCHVEQVQCREPTKTHKKYDSVMHVYLEVEVTPVPGRFQCNDACVRFRTEKTLRRIQKSLTNIVQSRRMFRKKHKYFRLKRKSLKVQKEFEQACPPGSALTGSTCVACSVGSWWSFEHNHCITCPVEKYQDEEGQITCKPCDNEIKKQPDPDEYCTGPCPPGMYSPTGMEPCQPCPIGTYQAHWSRTGCVKCEGNGTTEVDSSVHCVGYVTCKAGQRRTINNTCEDCAIGYYQPSPGQDFCHRCPVYSSTEATASTALQQCKRMTCGTNLQKYWGYVESPNYPVEYPRNSHCEWKIRPGKGRRLLLILPSIDLGTGGCKDSLVIRKSRSERSLTTFETCRSSNWPFIVPARTRNVWIRFTSSGNTPINSTGTGFHMSYVTYNEEYQPLIEDIVGDPKLYASESHLKIFTDRQLMASLIEVIAHPISYYKYSANQKQMFPDSFIRYITPKVKKFLSFK